MMIYISLISCNVLPPACHKFSNCTQQKTSKLFQVDENSIEQYFAANIGLGC